MPETSVVVKAEDRYSSAVKKMASTTNAFSKDAEEMEKTLTALSKKRFDLRMDLDKAKKELKDAEKQFQATGDAADRMTAQGKQANFDALQKQLRDVNKEAKQVEKGLDSMGSTARKLDNQGFGKAIMGSGLGKMLGDAAGQLGDAWLSSVIGEPSARVASGILSGAVTGIGMGAAAGSIFGFPGWAAGAALGAVAGGISGSAQIFQAEDDAFKAHYAQSVETAMVARDAELSRGSSTAAGRKTDRISFSNLFGDEETAEGYLSDLVGMANATPFLYDDLTAMSKTLATYGYGADSILPALQTIGDAGAALGMGASDMSMVATALGRMKSSNKTTLEYLNILNDRGIGAVGMLADAYGVDQGTVYDMISKGKIAGTDAVEIILEALGEAFQGAMKEQSETFSGKTSTLQGLEQEMENAMGAAYNEGALAGIQGDIDAYNGALGDALQGMNAMIGEGRAMAENLERQYKREALEALTGTGRTTLYDEDQAERLGRLNTEYEALRKEFDTADEARKAATKAINTGVMRMDEAGDAG